MGIVDFFLKRRAFAWVINIVILILGLIGLTQMSVKLYPQHKKHNINIECKISDASPKQLESQVTIILEKALGGIYGLKDMYSRIKTGSSNTTLSFDESVSLDEAFGNVQAALARIRSELPKEEKLKLDISKSGSHESSLLFLLFRNQNKSIDELYDFISRNFENTVKSQPGVASVNTWGGSKYEAKIMLDSNKMKFLNVEMNDIYEAIKMQNIKSDIGKLVTQDNYINVMFDNSINSERDIENIFIRTRNGSEEINIRIRDIGKVQFVPAKEESISKLNGERVIVMGIVPQTSASPVDMSDNIKAKIEKWEELLPNGTSIDIMFNNANHIQSSIWQVTKTIIEAVILIILMVWIFLGSVSSSMIPLATIPVSLIGSFSVLQFFDCSINIFTMLALVLAVGLVVDDAIVVLENIYRHIEGTDKSKPLDPEQAASKGGNEIQFSVIAMTLTLAIVYSPIALVGGTIGSLFKEFAIALSASVLISGVVSLTISPIMCANILKQEHKPSRVYLYINNLINNFLKVYNTALQKTLKRKFFTLFFGIAIIFTSVLMYRSSKFEEFPNEDSKRIEAVVNVSPGYDIDYILRQTNALDEKIKSDFPEIKYTMVDTKVGETNLHLEVHPDAENSFDLADRMNRVLNAYMTSVKNLRINAVNPAANIFGSGSKNNEIRVQVFAKSDQSIESIEKEVYKLTNIINNKFKDTITGIYYHREPKSKQRILKLDGYEAANSGIKPSDLMERLSMYFQENVATTHMNKNDQIYSIRLATDNRSQSHFDILSVRGIKNGEYINIPLKSIVTIEEKETESSIEHVNGRKCMTFSISIPSNVNPIELYSKIQQELKKEIHDDYAFEPLGVVKQILEEQVNVAFIFMMSLIFIYLVMSTQFNSFIDPIIILCSAPMAISGALLTIWINGFFGGPLTINTYTQIGFLTLIGLITKNGILLVDFANSYKEENNVSHDESIIKSCMLRFRPILMTTLAMVISAIPLVISYSAGSEARQQIGYCIIGGMSFGTIFTLFILPAFYSIVHDIRLFLYNSLRSRQD